MISLKPEKMCFLQYAYTKSFTSYLLILSVSGRGTIAVWFRKFTKRFML